MGNIGATKEHWQYPRGERVWVGKYKNSQNILHWHGDCELVFAERGSIAVVCDGNAYTLESGDGMFIASKSLHRIRALDSDALLVTIIFDNRIISDFAENITLSQPKFADRYGIMQAYLSLLDELTTKTPLYVYNTAATVNKLMLDIFRGERTEPKKPARKTDAKLLLLLEDMHKNYADYSLAKAAEFAGMNASYLSRFFAENTGLHFNRYLNCIRMENAVAMLDADDRTVTEVAAECGFYTIRNFNRIFKLLTGYAPTAMPRDYVFSATAAMTTAAAGTSDPTLRDCELVECSSPRYRM